MRRPGGRQREVLSPVRPEHDRALAAPEPNRPAAAPSPAGPPSLEKYQSPDGKVLLYKPQGWNVAQGDMFGPGTYGVTVMEPQENAVVLFITFPAGRADQGLRRAGRPVHRRPAGQVSRSPGDQHQLDAPAGAHDRGPDLDGRG